MYKDLEINSETAQEYDDITDAVLLIDKLTCLVNLVVKGKKTPSITQSKQLTDMTQDAKTHVANLHAKYLLLKGRYIEQEKTLSKLLSRGTASLDTIKSAIAKELASCKQTPSPFPTTSISYSTAAKRGLEPQQSKNKVILLYPHESKKDQPSEDTKMELQTNLNPQEMKLRINRVSKIRNGGVAIEVPRGQEVGIMKHLENKFTTREPKVNRPKFKLFDVPADIEKEKLMDLIYNQNFSEQIDKDKFSNSFIPLFKTGP